jgi:hypothetical protein
MAWGKTMLGRVFTEKAGNTENGNAKKDHGDGFFSSTIGRATSS